MYLDDMTVGMEIEIPAAVIDKERMLDFARLYDPMPLHTDEEYANGTRFGGLIAPGVMSFMAVWARFVETGFFGNELVAGVSTKITWYKPVFAGDTLTGTARVTGITRRNAYNGLAEVTIEVRNQQGDMVLGDVTEFVVRYRDCVSNQFT